MKTSALYIIERARQVFSGRKFERTRMTVCQDLKNRQSQRCTLRYIGGKPKLEAGDEPGVDLKHRIANRDDCDRVHLVIDARANPWVETLIADSLASR